MKFVLDCSVTMPWLFKNDPSGYAEKVLKRFQRDEALVPSLWNLEVLNVLLQAQRRGQITEAESERFLHWLGELPVEEVTFSRQAIFDRVAGLAREHKLTSYDATYLDLSIQQGVALATLDRDLKKAAQSAGVSLIE